MAQRFYQWLMRQIDRQDPVGELARDIRAGRGIPDGDTWLHHWLTGDVDGQIQRWRLAWAEWEQDNGLSPIERSG